MAGKNKTTSGNISGETHGDAIVIGGSYAGLSAAIQLARTGRKVCVIDTGKPRNRFASASHGFFSLDGAAPQQMLADAREKLAAYPSAEFVNDVAEEAGRNERGFAVRLGSGTTRTATKVVLAFGVTDTLPDIPGLAERWGQSVVHCPYCHGYEFLGQRLGVLRLSPMSIHQALLVADWGPVTLFLNGGDKPEDKELSQLAERGVSLEASAVKSLQGEGKRLSGVRLEDGRSVALDALFLGTRTSLASPLAEQLGCEFDDGLFGPVVRTDAFKMTTVPGVYAAGDIARAPHSAIWAAADGVTAGTALHRALVFEPLEAA